MAQGPGSGSLLAATGRKATIKAYAQRGAGASCSLFPAVLLPRACRAATHQPSLYTPIRSISIYICNNLEVLGALKDRKRYVHYNFLSQKYMYILDPLN